MIKSIYFKETMLDLRSLLRKHFMHKIKMLIVFMILAVAQFIK